jgi:hypothetical protein
MQDKSMKNYVIGAVAAVLIITAGVVIWFLMPHKPGPAPDPKPSGKYKVDPIKLPDEPWTLVDKPGTSAGNGAAEVAEAVKSFHQAAEDLVNSRRLPGGDKKAADLDDQIRDAYDNPSKMADSGPPWKCADLLIASADKKDFDLDSKFTDDVLQWHLQATGLNLAMECIARAALTEAVLTLKADKAKALNIARSVMILGVRLTQDKASLWLRRDGLEIQGLAAAALVQIFEGSDKADQAKSAGDYSTLAFKAKMAMDRTFNNLFYLRIEWNKEKGDNHADGCCGDYLLFARKHADTAWRVQAALTLGVFKLSRNGRAYREQVDRCLDELAADSDPQVAAAAKWGLPLNGNETYQKLTLKN